MYWTYENWVHQYAKVHRAECSYCNHGQGSHGAGRETGAGRWHGPFRSYAEASSIRTRYLVSDCGHCTPAA